MVKRFLSFLLLGFSLVGLLGQGSMSAGEQGNGTSRIISVLGISKLQGQDTVVEILAKVNPGQNPNDVAQDVLHSQGARPFGSANLGSEGFTVTGLVWDTTVIQNYNSQSEPVGVDAQTALTNTHDTWNAVATSNFVINFGGATDRCPSLVKECTGPQFFDGYNDVGWQRLQSNILGVTWFGIGTDEADMALNHTFSWNDGCFDADNSYDVQTVFLHENGHVVGLGHSNDPESVMQAVYHGADCDLGNDDIEGATFLYDDEITGSVSGIVKDTNDVPISGATVLLEGTSFKTTTGSDGTYTISNVPDPVHYTIKASKKGASDSIRELVDEATTIDFTLTSGSGGGGACPPAKEKQGKC